MDTLNELALHVQRGHIQVLASTGGEEDLLDTSERDKLRASYLRQRLAGVKPAGTDSAPEE
jgi:protein-arginine kinase